MKILLIILTASLFNITSAQNKNGLIKEYYPNDTLKSSINFKDNVREGEAKFYYSNGQLKQELTYVNGKVDGLVKDYNENGKLKELYNIEDGKREGPTSIFDSTGVYLKDIEFIAGKLVPPKSVITEKKNNSEIADKDKGKKEETQKLVESRKKKVVEGMLPPTIKEKDLSDDPAYFLSAEIMPEPVGGMEAIMRRLSYPSEARNKGIEGTVKVLTFIDQYGEVEDAKVVKGIGYGCDEAARTAIFYTKFRPGIQRGKPVKVQMVIPIKFSLPK